MTYQFGRYKKIKDYIIPMDMTILPYLFSLRSTMMSYGPSVGITKVLFNSSIGEMFDLVNACAIYIYKYIYMFKSHPYLTDVATAHMQRHLLNMNLYSIANQYFDKFEKLGK